MKVIILKKCGRLITAPAFLIFFLLTSFAYAKIDNLKLSGEEETAFREILQKNIPNFKDVRFHVIYLIDKKYCERCVYLEMVAGWLEVPPAFKNRIKIDALTNFKDLKDKLNEKQNKNINIRFVNGDSQIDSILKKNNGLAIFYDSNADEMYKYKVSSAQGLFREVYTIFDSSAFAETAGSIWLGDNYLYEKEIDVRGLKDIQISARKDGFELLSPMRSYYIKIDTTGKIIREYIAAPDVFPDSVYDERVFGYARDYYEICGDRGVLLNTIYCEPYETVQFNKKVLKYRKAGYVFDFFSRSAGKIVFDSTIEKIGDGTYGMKASYDADVYWAPFLSPKSDSTKGTFQVMQIACDAARVIEFDLKYIDAVSPELTTAIGEELVLIDSAGRVSYLGSENKSAFSFDIYYFPNNLRFSSFFDGSSFSIDAEIEGRRYLVLYSEFGQLLVPPILVLKNSINFFITAQNKIYSFFYDEERYDKYFMRVYGF